jgi:hypothetical protein
MIVKRQSSSASPRQVLAAIDPLSSTTVYPGALGIAICLEGVVGEEYSRRKPIVDECIRHWLRRIYRSLFALRISPANGVLT